MIFYFSGTGNSLDVARQMAELCDDSIISIADEMKKGKGVYDYSLGEGDAIGFVFPVYAWGPPLMVTDFISKLSIVGPPGSKKAPKPYTYAIATCGDNIGNTMDIMSKALAKKGLQLAGGFSIIMPNTYIFMWDVDTDEEIEKRLGAAKDRVTEISETVRNRETGVFYIEKGPVPFIFTGIINPLFNKFAMDTKKFYAEDTCTSCGLCEEICPTGNIKVDGKPVWGSDCTQCLACIHRCPEKAIQYGKKTKARGRYINPGLR